jgi:lipid-binding SYLF domain-containing protein
MNSFSRRRILVSAAAAVGVGLTTEAEAATGYIRLHVVSAGFILGVGGGDGVLQFQGRSYPLTLGGLSVGATIGISGADLVGTVHHLHDFRDIAGTYTAAGAGVAIAGGAAVADLSNARGVLLRLRGKQVGFKFSIAAGGLTIGLK